MTPTGYLLFHLNLAFSSVPEEARPDVVRQCYHPLLDLVEDAGLPVGVELSGWTLSRVAELDAAWVQRLRGLLAAGRCELVGSGWTQMIGPLAPHRVNRWNQRLGRQAYRQLLDAEPALALVNEMAFAAGLVEVYAEAGYQALVMDRDNVRLALGLAGTPLAAMPTHARGAAGGQLPVLWTDSNLFQGLQRAVHGDKPPDEYLAYVRQRAVRDGVALPIYSNDAEVFDYRPGRFTTEAARQSGSEWARLAGLCHRLHDELGLQWQSPSQALAADLAARPHQARHLASVAQPVPVKKQAKYNLNRWTVSGRDDLWLNSSCHALHQALAARDQALAARDPAPAAQDAPDEDRWRALCEFWASDLRTHITESRWAEARQRVQAALQAWGPPAAPPEAPPAAPPVPAPHWQPLADFQPPAGVVLDSGGAGLLLRVHTPFVQAELNARRGLAIAALGFASRGFEPVVGTLPQGYFDSIELGADFYSGGVLMESPGLRQRVTDLERVQPLVACQDGWLLLQARLPFAGGRLVKTLRLGLHQEVVALHYDFEDVARPLGSLRVGVLSFLNERLALPLVLHVCQGGAAAERFVVDQPAQHGAAVSVLVSSTTGFGASDGRLRIDDARGPVLSLQWNPAECAAVPMLTHQPSLPQPFTRLQFSLCELDDTLRPGGSLRPFELRLLGPGAAG